MGFKPRKKITVSHGMTLRPCLLCEVKSILLDIQEQMSTGHLSGVRDRFQSERVAELLCLAPWTGLGDNS